MACFDATSVTVVVPTFNRGDALLATLTALLASATVGLRLVEIIVVDDGSPQPAAPLVNSVLVEPPFTLRCLRQPNSGPGPARNTGFREAQGGIVIFVDDDILVPPRLIQKHIRAHADHPHSVIYGLAALLEPACPTALHRFIRELAGGADQDPLEPEFTAVDVPASGHISVERGMFPKGSALYSDKLSTPAAEEFELAYRLRQLGVPILFAPRIVARHDQPLDLASVCRQQQKHALGAAEVIKKYPATRALPALEKIMRANLDPPRRLTLQALKRAAVRCLASAPVRKNLLRSTEWIQDRFLAPAWLYRAVISAHYHAGLRDGSRRVWS